MKTMELIRTRMKTTARIQMMMTTGSSNDSSGEEGDIIDEEDALQSHNWIDCFRFIVIT